MAQFNAFLPDDEIKKLKKLSDNTPKMMDEMTKAGATVAMNKLKRTVPVPAMASHIKLSKQYKTPTDGAHNTKVYFSGYLPFKGGRTTFSRSGGSGGKYVTRKGIPVEFLVNVFEYGRSGYPFPKRPFFRMGFNEAEINRAMLKAQKKASGGILDE